MKLFSFLLLIFAAPANGRDPDQVLAVTPLARDHLLFLMSERSGDLFLDFWTAPTEIGKVVHVMGLLSNIKTFKKRLDVRFIPYEVAISNVEEWLAKSNEDLRGRRDADSNSNAQHFNVSRYNTYPDIVKYLKDLTVRFPEIARIQSIGQTHEKRDIMLIEISANSTMKKPAVWIDGGIHAREWLAPATVTYMISLLTEGYGSDLVVTELVDSLTWYIVPVLNPDGYEFSWNSTRNRLWRKNRSPENCFNSSGLNMSSVYLQDLSIKEMDGFFCCQGVDLNRNFGWHHAERESLFERTPCTEQYSGASAFSEPETAAVRNFLSVRADWVKVFLSFHAYSQYLMYPYSYDKWEHPDDIDDLHKTGLRAAAALKAVYGTKYKVGTVADVIYEVSGSSVDWAKGSLKIKYVYAFELRPFETKDFNVDQASYKYEGIVETAVETWEAVKVIANDSLSFHRNITIPDMPVSNANCVILYACCICILLHLIF
ncbi:hypothetical protein L596_004716 [Steinernema carpocapsae]|uniref:Peptidase M14 domain-containing protein n=1 Tax=Steinernema carpocapsae TaxID=34508 RepID=A0A4U8UWS5_STECR|nr:hypothetical protein L596_004716 [Steinernema carpocapsae]